MWKWVRAHHPPEKSRRDKARWDEERRSWLAREARTGQAVRRYLSSEAFSTDLAEWAAVGWKVGSQSSRELRFRAGERTLTWELITVTYVRQDTLDR
jgi:hypothetical protein